MNKKLVLLITLVSAILLAFILLAALAPAINFFGEWSPNIKQAQWHVQRWVDNPDCVPLEAANKTGPFCEPVNGDKWIRPRLSTMNFTVGVSNLSGFCFWSQGTMTWCTNPSGKPVYPIHGWALRERYRWECYAPTRAAPEDRQLAVGPFWTFYYCQVVLYRWQPKFWAEVPND